MKDQQETQDIVFEAYKDLERNAGILNNFLHEHLSISKYTAKTIEWNPPISEESEAGIDFIVSLHDDQGDTTETIGLILIRARDQIENTKKLIKQAKNYRNLDKIYVISHLDIKDHLQNAQYRKVPRASLPMLDGAYPLEEFFYSIENTKLNFTFADGSKTDFEFENDNTDKLGTLKIDGNERLVPSFVTECAQAALDQFSREQIPRTNERINKKIQVTLDLDFEIELDEKEVTSIEVEMQIDMQFRVAPVGIYTNQKDTNSQETVISVLRQNEMVDLQDMRYRKNLSPEYTDWLSNKGPLILHSIIGDSPTTLPQYFRSEEEFTKLVLFINDTQRMLEKIVLEPQFSIVSNALNILADATERMANIYKEIQKCEKDLASYNPREEQDLFLPEIQDNFKNLYIKYYESYYSTLGALMRFLKIANTPLKGMTFPSQQAGIKGKLGMLTHNELNISEEDRTCLEKARLFRAKIVSHIDDISGQKLLTWDTFNIYGKCYITCSQDAPGEAGYRIDSEKMTQIAESEGYLLEELVGNTPEDSISTAPPASLTMKAFCSTAKKLLKHSIDKQTELKKASQINKLND